MKEEKIRLEGRIVLKEWNEDKKKEKIKGCSKHKCELTSMCGGGGDIKGDKQANRRKTQ